MMQQSNNPDEVLDDTLARCPSSTDVMSAMAPFSSPAVVDPASHPLPSQPHLVAVASSPLAAAGQLGLISTSYTHIGRRPNQEDRLVSCTDVLGDGLWGFFAVLDGTVKEHAAEFCHTKILDNMRNAASFRRFVALSPAEQRGQAARSLLEQAMTETYLETDRQVFEWCASKDLHYSSCTSVSALISIANQLAVVAHLGDSKVALGRKHGGTALTIDHKPDVPAERARIESCGGSVVYLHGNKPFLRGGDFEGRTHAMQLNYSRAFGGKDLKMYGLSAQPDLCSVSLTPDCETILLASDGLWDVCTPHLAATYAIDAIKKGKNPAEALGVHALLTHDVKGTADNVTVVCVQLVWDVTNGRK